MLRETGIGQYKARGVFIDTDPEGMAALKRSEGRAMIDHELTVGGRENASSVFSRGRYTVGAEIMAYSTDAIRRAAEQCDSLAALVVLNGIGEGTGSGHFASVSDTIADEFAKKTRLNFVVTPSQALGGSILEPYNAVCGFNAQLTGYHLNVQVENEAIAGLLKSRVRVESPGFREINRLIAQLVSSVTLPARNGHDISNLGPNLVPFPRLHFAVPSLGPLIPAEQKDHESLALPSLISEVFSNSS